MSQYRMVSQRFWENTMTEQWSREEREVMLYLITCQQSQVCGLFPIALQTIAHHWDIPVASVEVAIRSLEQRACLFYDGGMVFLRKYLEGQNAKKLGKIREHVRNIGITSLRLPNRACEAFIRKYILVIRSDEDFHKELITVLGEPFIAIAKAIIDTIDTIDTIDNYGIYGKDSKPKTLPVRSAVEYFLDLIPKPLSAKPGFNEAWVDWIDARAENGDPVGIRYAKSALKILGTLRDPVHALLRSVEWKGIHPDEQHEAMLERQSRDRERGEGQQRYIRQEAATQRASELEWQRQRADPNAPPTDGRPSAAQREFMQALDRAAEKMRVPNE